MRSVAEVDELLVPLGNELKPVAQVPEAVVEVVILDRLSLE